MSATASTSAPPSSPCGAATPAWASSSSASRARSRCRRRNRGRPSCARCSTISCGCTASSAAAAIRIEWLRCDDIAPQALDQPLMEQALLNIVKNAVEAVEAAIADGARVDGYIRLALAREEAGVRLSVIDSGDRLGDVPAHQLFAPFFTTKKGGQGIGLLFVREVLNRHGFPYRLAPGGDGETRFDIWLPQPH